MKKLDMTNIMRDEDKDRAYEMAVKVKSGTKKAAAKTVEKTVVAAAVPVIAAKVTVKGVKAYRMLRKMKKALVEAQAKLQDGMVPVTVDSSGDVLVGVPEDLPEELKEAIRKDVEDQLKLR